MWAFQHLGHIIEQGGYWIGIYCLEIFAFRHQIVLSKHKLRCLLQICLFVATIYTSF